ncbi:MAG: hypothetical protein WGN25_00665 [Candidatus Electrothrix sp. GW3-4]|uniref:hypothetical protein n=1 Tax=Candidatus Electrothrix sp. GW3-4 TaxID=3126740 RepID=UPI0030CBA564
MVESRGVVYVATGEKFVTEALISVRSVKRQMPELPVTLFTDLQELVASPPEGVDVVFHLTQVTNSCLDKMYPLAESPYERTLFLDTDTYLCDRIDELFDVLDNYDIAAAHPPYRVQYHLPDIPECFPEPNTGVIAFKRTSGALEVLSNWSKEYKKQLASPNKPHHDQHSFRAALYHSTARFLVLPQEYNFRNIGPNFAGKGSKIKIIHGRHASFERLEARLNANLDYRVFLMHPGRIFTHELVTYKGAVEALNNAVFEALPNPIKHLLSNLRRRCS